MSKIDIIKEVCEGNLPIDKQYEILRSCQKEDLVSKEDHLLYIKAVASFRNSLMNSIKLIGQNFLNLLESLLSVGEEGVYTNNQRFIYELIQNVDDCEYDDISNCNLDIQFCFDEEPGKIILVYNEKGFTPENVFAITGIAEASKNL